MEKSELIEVARKMMAANSCCEEAKTALDAWIKAVGTPQEKEAAQKLVAELEEDVTPIDGLIGFLQGPAKKLMGEEKAGAMLKKAEEAKAAGEDTCICDACQAGKILLQNKEVLLG